MNGIYYVIRNKETGQHLTKTGQSSAPHLYLSKKKAESMCYAKHWEVVPVQLTEIKGAST